MRSAEQILLLYKDRKAKYAPLHQKMRVIADIYNGRAEVPLPDMDQTEMPSVPNLLQQGVDQMAGRITSVIPAITFSSMKPGVRIYDRRAMTAADTISGWWQSDRLPMKMKVRGRRLIAYAMAPVIMRWDYDDHRPKWEVRHPMEAFPSLDLQPGQVRPQDCIFSYTRTIGWLVDAGYGEQVWRLIGGQNSGINPTRDTLVNMIEYIDADHTVLMAAGHYSTDYWNGEYADAEVNGLRGVILAEYPNVGDDTPVIIPTRLTLDSMTGQFDNMIGMYFHQAKLMALETIAVEKGIFPDTYLVSRPGEVGRFTDGPHDGRTGRVNIVQGGDIREVQTQPGYMTQQTIDRLERAQRVTSGIPAEFGGESGSNIRTGRRGDAVLSAVIDFPVAEAQEIFAYALEEENEIAMKMAKRIDGMTPRTIYVGVGNSRKPVTYKASEVFENEEHVVAYPAAGSDINSLIIGLGQRVGLGYMSKRTAAELDPFIDSPEREHDAIIAESLEMAVLTGIQQKVASGEMPPLVAAKIATLVKNDKMELAEAMNKVTEDAAKEQAAAAAAPPDPMQAQTPDQMTASATTQSLAGATVADPRQSMPGVANLGQMLGTLRRPNMTIVPDRNVSAGGM